MKGLYHKYNVSDITGASLEDCFVLRPETDPHARAAIAVYAASVTEENSELAHDLYRWLNLIGKEEPAAKRKKVEFVRDFEGWLHCPCGMKLRVEIHRFFNGMPAYFCNGDWYSYEMGEVALAVNYLTALHSEDIDWLLYCDDCGAKYREETHEVTVRKQ